MILLYVKEIEIIQEKPVEMDHIDLVDGLITGKLNELHVLTCIGIAVLIIVLFVEKKHPFIRKKKKTQSKKKLTRNEKLWQIYGKQNKTFIDRIKMKHYEAQNRRERS